MSQVKQITNEDHIIEVINNAHVVWEKFDSNDEGKFTTKLLYKNRSFILYKDGPDFWMEELLDEFPEEIRKNAKPLVGESF